VSRSSKLLQQELRYRDPRYPDEPRTVHQLGRVSGDPRKSGFGESGISRDRELLQLGIAKRDIPTGELCGPQGVSGGQVAYHIGDREKESPESIDIRIRDPANSEIPIEVTGGGKVNSHVCIGVSAHRVSGVGKSSA
jgi:hypothetical protein